jgi:hypothetical protein
MTFWVFNGLFLRVIADQRSNWRYNHTKLDSVNFEYLIDLVHNNGWLGQIFVDAERGHDDDDQRYDLNLQLLRYNFNVMKHLYLQLYKILIDDCHEFIYCWILVIY